MFEIFYEKRQSEKGSFDVIYVDVGYRKIYLSFDKGVIAETLSISVAELYAYKVGTKIRIGSINTKKA